MRKFTLSLFLLLLTSLAVMAQNPIIGDKRNADPSSVLELNSTNQGFLLPRLTEEQRDAIKNPALGLTIFNITINCIDSYTGKEGGWVSNCGVVPAVIADLNCESITIGGTYQQNKALDGTNFIKLTANVLRAGEATITARAYPDNNYFFTYTGSLPKGMQQITLEAKGMPLNFNEDPSKAVDTVKITVNGKMSDCKIPNEVKSAPRTDYIVDCSSIVVNSMPSLKTSLAPTDNIQVTITSSSTGDGLVASVTTDQVGGFSFSGSAILPPAGSKVTITLTPDAGGLPIAAGPISKTLKFNNVANSTCSANMTIGYPALLVAGFGDTGGYGYYACRTGTATNNFLKSTANFGMLPTSTVKTKEFRKLEDKGGDDIATYLSTTKPDIIILGHGYDLNFPGRVNAIKNYLDQKGVVIIFDQDDVNRSAQFLNTVFNTTGLSIEQTGGGSDYYRIKSVNDAITNGPFGNMVGKYMGDDYDASFTIKGTLPADATVYATYDPSPVRSGNNGLPVIVGSKSKSFIWVGDGGFLSQGDAIGTDQSKNQEPFFLDGTNQYKPATKQYGNNSGYKDIYNSFFFGNLMNWAIQKATTGGINTY